MKKLLAILLLLNLNLHAAEEGLLHQWRFDQAKNGKVSAKIGAAVNYNGTAQLVEEGGLSQLRLKGTDSRAWVTDDHNTVKVPKKSITVEAWISPAASMRWGGIAGVIQDNGDYERGWLLGYVNRKFSFALASKGHQRLTYLQGTTDFKDELWYHVVGTYDGEDLKVYVNGKLEATEAKHSGDIIYPPKATFELGGYKDDNEFYRGAISLHEISIHEKALEADVIAKRFASRKNEFPLPPDPLRFVSLPQLRWKKRDTLQIEWELPESLPVEISWKRADGTGLRKIPAKAGKKGETLIDQLKPQGEYLYRFTARNTAGTEFTSEWFKFDTSFYKFVSLPQLRWKKRNTLQMEWEFSHPLPMEISWKRAEDKDSRKIPVKAGKKGVALIDQLKPQGEYLYRFTAQGATEPEFTSEWYKFDTSFYYRLPSIPNRPNPFTEDGMMRTVQSAAKQILSKNEFDQGYALILGSVGGRLAYELARQTELQVVVVEPDETKAQTARKALSRAGLYGSRVSVHQGNLDNLPYGPYFANLITSGSMLTEGNLPGQDASQLMDLLRPAGGVVVLGHMSGKLNEQSIQDWFSKGGTQCTVSDANGGLWAYVKRGKLEGAGDWTHQYGSADNTTNSRDDLVRGEMGILWWGEPGPRPMPDRGGRNPAPLSANGRMFVQGDRVLFGMDAYNGTVLWTFFSPEMRRSNMPRDGSNMVATDDTLYITIGGECIALNAQTGKREISVKAPQGRDVGWLSANNKQLLTTTVKNSSNYEADSGEWYDGVGAADVQRVVSDALLSHNSVTGKEQWAYRGGAVMNSTITIAEDIIYFVESRNAKLSQSANSRIAPAELTSQHLVALNRASGEKLWEKPVDFSKCENMLYLIHAEGTLVASGSDRNKKYHIYAYDVSSPALRFGTENPEIPELWRKNATGSGSKGDANRQNHHGGHLQHPLVVGQTLYSDWRAFDLRSGDRKKNITVPERRGCGNMAASNHSMFYRHHSQTMWDLDTGTTTTLQGSRTGCWLGIIPAQGLMLAPESSGGCSCLSEHIAIQTSAAWIPKASLKKPKKKR